MWNEHFPEPLPVGDQTQTQSENETGPRLESKISWPDHV